MIRTQRLSRPLGHHRSRVTGKANEAGASLVYILVILILMSLVITALFAYADSGSRALRAHRQNRILRTAADSALDAAVARVARNPRLGESGTVDDCILRFPIMEGSDEPVMHPGSVLVVRCEPSPETHSGGLDASGAQLIRDVTFTVSCRQNEYFGRKYCGEDASDPLVVLARARIRYEIDYSWDREVTPPTLDNKSKAGRARVPKVMTWSVLAG